jgi:hypothetical protein
LVPVVPGGTRTLSITTVSMTGLFVTVSINHIQHKPHSATICIMCIYAEYCIIFNVMLNVAILSVVTMSVTLPWRVSKP